MDAGEADLTAFESREATLERLVDLVDGAREELSLSVPEAVLSTVEPALRDAVDRGVLVLLLVCEATDDPPAGAATVTRRTPREAGLNCTADFRRGLTAPGRLVTGDWSDGTATAFADENLAYSLFGEFIGNYWLLGQEIDTADPKPLSYEYDYFRRAVVDAALRLREREVIHAVVEGRAAGSDDDVTVSGTVINARQGVVYPVTNAAPVEHSLVLKTDDGRLTAGGRGAYLEDYGAHSVRFERDDRGRATGGE